MTRRLDLWWISALLLSVSALAGLVLESWLAAIPIAAVAFLALFAVTVASPVRTMAVVLVALGTAGLPLGAQGIDVGIRIYPLDFLLAALLLAWVSGVLADRTRWSLTWPHRGAFVVLLAFLTLSLAHGLLAGNDPRNALGDYRRMALYPLTLFVFAAIANTPAQMDTLLRALVVAGYGTVGIAMVRIVTGTGYAEEHLAGTTIRYLSYVEASTAGLAVLIAVGFARASGGRTRMLWWLAAFPPFVALLASNYRTAWIALAAGLAAQGMALGWRRGVKALGAAFIVLIPVTYFVVTRTSLGAFILDRFNLENISTSGLWRYFSWRAALTAWLGTPVLGTGLGYAHYFEMFNIEVGKYTASTTSSIHNDPLWFLVNNGLVGLVVAAFFVVPWTRRAFALARSPDLHARQVGSTALGSLLLMTVVSCLQPYFSTAATVAIAMVFVALVIRTPLPEPAA